MKFRIVSFGLLGVIALTSSAKLVANDNLDETSDDGHLVITATRLDRDVDQVAPSVTYVSDQTIEEQLAATFDDVFRYQPGLSMATAVRGGNTGLTIRGIGGKRVLMLMDGVPAADVFFAGLSAYGNDLFDLSSLESIEIIRGPSSSLYGANALAGVVLLNTKEAEDYIGSNERWVGQLKALGNSSNRSAKFDVTAARSFERGGALFQVGRNEFSESDVAGNGQQLPQEGLSENFLAKFNYHFSPTNELLLTLEQFTDHIQYELSEPSALRSFGYDDSVRQRFSLQHSWRVEQSMADEWHLRLFKQTTDALQHTEQQLATSFSFPSAPFGTGNLTGRVSDFEFNQSVKGLGLDAKKEATFAWGKFSSVFGVEADVTATERPRNRCETDSVSQQSTCAIVAYPMAPAEVFPNKTFPDTRTKKHGAFWQTQFQFNDSFFSAPNSSTRSSSATSLVISPGLRWDQITMTSDSSGMQEVIDLGYAISSSRHHKVTPNLGIIFPLTHSSQLNVYYAEGFRVPSYDEANQSFINLAHGYAIVPNAELKPESSRGVEISYRVNTESMVFHLTGFKNDYQDFIEGSFIGMSNGIMLFQDANINNVEISGVEIYSEYSLSEYWQLSHSLAFAEGENKDTGQYLNSIEPLTFVTQLSYQDPRWAFHLHLTATDEKDKVSSNSDVTSPGYVVADFTGSFTMSDSLIMRFGVLNITDKSYARWANIQGLPNDAESLPKLRQPGRHFRVGMTYSF